MIVAILACVDSCGPTQETVQSPGNTDPSPDIGVFMKTHINPPFSKLSFLLYQKQGAPGSEGLISTANELSRAAAELGDWSELPTDSAQGRQVFYEYAAALRSEASSLVGALSANRRDAAIKVFEELRKKCDSCHHFFRYGE